MKKVFFSIVICVIFFVAVKVSGQERGLKFIARIDYVSVDYGLTIEQLVQQAAPRIKVDAHINSKNFGVDESRMGVVTIMIFQPFGDFPDRVFSENEIRSYLAKEKCRPANIYELFYFVLSIPFVPRDNGHYTHYWAFENSRRTEKSSYNMAVLGCPEQRLENEKLYMSADSDNTFGSIYVLAVLEK